MTPSPDLPLRLDWLTTVEARTLLAMPKPAVLLPVGSVEPHGPHLPLGTDTVISEEACLRAAVRLRARGVRAVVAPSVPFGVTNFAKGFAGAISVKADVLTAFLGAVAEGMLADGWKHVCLVNNHLEPEHDRAVRAVCNETNRGRISVACPLRRRWAATLSEEFQRGNCHAGEYETSLVLAARSLEDWRARVLPHDLAPLDVSLSDGIRAGRTTFAEMGMNDAYTGAPSAATQDEGEQLYERLVTMIVTEVQEAMG